MKRVHWFSAIVVFVIALICLVGVYAQTKSTAIYRDDVWNWVKWECPVNFWGSTTIGPESDGDANILLFNADGNYTYIINDSANNSFVIDFDNKFVFRKNGVLTMNYYRNAVPIPGSEIVRQQYQSQRQSGTEFTVGNQVAWIEDTTSTDEAGGWEINIATDNHLEAFFRALGSTGGTGTASVNPDSNDIDFKVYSDAGLGLHLDASTGYWDMDGILSTNATDIRINPDSTDTDLYVFGDNGEALILDALNHTLYHKNIASMLEYHYNTASIDSGDTDNIKRVLGYANNSTSSLGQYTEFASAVFDAYASARAGMFYWKLASESTMKTFMKIYGKRVSGTNAKIQMNPDQYDIDFEAFWDSGKALFVDGETGNVTLDKDLYVDENIRYLAEVIDITTTTTITGADSLMGATFTNQGNADADTINLPGAVVGYHFKLLIAAATDMDINPDDADRILACSDLGDAISSDATVGSWIDFTAISDSTWFVQSSGTWTDVN